MSALTPALSRKRERGTSLDPPSSVMTDVSPSPPSAGERVG